MKSKDLYESVRHKANEELDRIYHSSIPRSKTMFELEDDYTNNSEN